MTSILSILTLSIVQLCGISNPRTESIYNHPLVVAVMSAGKEGGVKLRLQTSLDFSIDERIRLLECKTIWKELELSDEQIVSLEAVLSWNLKQRKKIIDLWDNREKEKAKSELSESSSQLAKKIDDILIRHQQEVLSKIRLRVLIRRRGIIDVLSSPPSGVEFDFKQDQWKEVNRILQSAREDWFEYSKIQKQKLVNDCVSSLDRDQKKKLDVMFKSFLMNTPFEIHLVHLDDFINKDRKTEQTENKSIYKAFKDLGSYHLTNDGSWEFVRRFEKWSEDSVAIFVVYALSEGGRLESSILGEDQKIELQKFRDNYLKKHREIQKEKRDTMKNGGDFEKASKTEKVRSNANNKELKLFLDKLITKEQKHKLMDLALRESVRSNGILFEITRGKLRDKLGLTKDQLGDLKQKLEKSHSKIKVELNRRETQLISKLKHALTMEQYDSLSRFYSIRLKHLYPSISLLLRQ